MPAPDSGIIGITALSQIFARHPPPARPGDRMEIAVAAPSGDNFLFADFRDQVRHQAPDADDGQIRDLWTMLITGLRDQSIPAIIEFLERLSRLSLTPLHAPEGRVFWSRKIGEDTAHRFYLQSGQHRDLKSTPIGGLLEDLAIFDTARRTHRARNKVVPPELLAEHERIASVPTCTRHIKQPMADHCELN